MTAVLVGLVAVAVALVLVTRSEDVAGARSPSTTRGVFADAGGDGTLRRARGEPLANRADLGRPARTGRTLAVLGQITDAHVRDEESPARAPFLDRLGEPFTSTFRPQEALSAQTLAAAVRSVNRLGPDAVIETGDLIDNAQRNELEQALAVLEGGKVRPGSGAPGYSGPQSVSRSDPFFYRPDLDAPRHRGLLAAAQRPFRSPGLRAPWYPVVGNHDVLVQGEAAPTPRLRSLATGSRMLVEPDRDLPLPRRSRSLDPQAIDRLLGHGLPGRTAATAPDPGRALLAPDQLMTALRRSSGHGGRGDRMDYAFPVGSSLEVIVLDTTSRSGGSRGDVTAGQATWLERRLAASGERWKLVVSHQPLGTARGGERAQTVLDADPRVVATLAGDSHRNVVRPRHTSSGGYWQIQTSSLTDYPQQARALRLVATAGGGVALETWMLDTASGRLADTARELAYLDAQGGRPQGNAGSRLDRNVRLFRAP